MLGPFTLDLTRLTFLHAINIHGVETGDGEAKQCVYLHVMDREDEVR